MKKQQLVTTSILFNSSRSGRPEGARVSRTSKSAPAGRPLRGAVILLSLLTCATPVFAAEPATSATSAPSSAPADATSLSATIIAVKGIVQVRTGDDQPWQKATVGMVVNEGAEFRTGLRSAVQFHIEPDQTITLDRLGTVKVLQAYQQKNKVTTDLGVKYGRTRYDIQAADLQHQSTIHSPGSTLAIRGTDVTYEDQVPWVPSAISRHGRAEFRDFNQKVFAFGGTRHTTVSADKNGPAQSAIATTKIDPRTPFAGRSETEENLLLSLNSNGGIDQQAQQALASEAKLGGFTGTFSGVPVVPGPLEFDLFWQSTLTTPNPTSFDLQVTSPKGQTASILTPTIGSGTQQGMYSGDNTGTSGNGAESVIFPLFFPAGTYKVTAISRSGDPANVTVLVNEGQSATPIKTYGLSPQPAIVVTPGHSFTASVRINK